MNYILRVLSGVACALVLSIAASMQQSPRLLVLNKEDATLAFVNAASGQVVGKVPTGEGPHELVVSTDGKLRSRATMGPVRRRATPSR